MLEKRDIRTIPGVRREEMWAKAWEWWTRQGFQLAQTGPYRCHGTSFYARIGLRREFDLIVDDSKDGCVVDLTFRARITEEGLIVGAITTVVLWPVALIGGAVSYSEYETDARNMMLAFWQYPSHPPGAPRGGPEPGLPTRCEGCASGLLPDWKVCPYCGRAKEA